MLDKKVFDDAKKYIKEGKAKTDKDGSERKKIVQGIGFNNQATTSNNKGVPQKISTSKSGVKGITPKADTTKSTISKGGAGGVLKTVGNAVGGAVKNITTGNAGGNKKVTNNVGRSPQSYFPNAVEFAVTTPDKTGDYILKNRQGVPDNAIGSVKWNEKRPLDKENDAISNYIPANYNISREEYSNLRAIEPSLPEFGSYDYFKRREETLRPIVDEIANDTDRMDNTISGWVENYRNGTLLNNNPGFLKMVEEYDRKFKYQDAIMAEYKDISNQLLRFNTFDSKNESNYVADTIGRYEWSKPMTQDERVAQWHKEQMAMEDVNITESIPYMAENMLAGGVDAVSDAGNYILAGGATLLRPFTWGGANKKLRNFADRRLSIESLGDVWKRSADARYDGLPDVFKEKAGSLAYNFGSLAPAIIAEAATYGGSPWLDVQLGLKGMSMAKVGLKSANAINLASKIKYSDIVFGLGAAGSYSQEAYKKTGNAEKSLAYGGLGGLAEVSTEKLFGGIAGLGDDAFKATTAKKNISDTLRNNKYIRGVIENKFVKNVSDSKIAKKAVDIGLEAVEEIIMAEVDPMLQRGTGVDKNAKSPEWKELIEAGKGGIMLSLFSNAIMLPVSKASSNIQKHSAIKTLNDNAEIINSMFVNEADKMPLLSNDATVEEIQQRQEEIKEFRDAYAEIYVNEVLNSVDAEDIIEKAGTEDQIINTEYPHLYDEDKVSKDFISSTNNEIENAIINIRNGDIDSVPDSIEVTKLSDDTIKRISDFIGFDVSDYVCKIEKDALIHIENRHGVNGEHDQSLSDPKDLARIGYVVKNIDRIDWVTRADGTIKTSKKYKDRNNNPAKIMMIQKKIDGTFCVSDVIPDSKNKIIWITSARIQKKYQDSDGTTAPPKTTSNNALGTSTTSISNNSPIVNTSDETKYLLKSLSDDAVGVYGRVSEIEGQNGVDSGTVLRNFNRFYLGGLRGESFLKLSARYGDRISYQSKKLAYEQGIAEAKQNEKSRVTDSKKAKVYEGGIENREALQGVEGIDKKQLDLIDRVSRILGAKVRISDIVKNSKGKEVNAKVLDGVVEISKKAVMGEDSKGGALRFLFNHEITHRIGELAPKQYRKFCDIALDYASLKTGLSVNELIDRYSNERGANGEDLNVFELMDEISADVAGMDIFSSDLIEYAARENIGVFEKMKNLLFDVLDKLGISKYSEIDKLKRTWQKAFDKAKKQAEINSRKVNLQEDSGVERNSYGGIKSKIADIKNLNYAKEMEINKENPDTILKETGWFKGIDGQWRFEIDDFNSFLIENPKLEEHNDDGNIYYTGKLNDILQHKSLFESYPALRNTEIIIQETDAGIGGMTSNSNNQIVLNKKLFERKTKQYDDILQNRQKYIDEIEKTPEYKKYNAIYEDDSMKPEEWLEKEKVLRDEFYSSEIGKRYHELRWGKDDSIQKYELGWSDNARSVLMHEVQHIIQGIEGFSGGSSPKSWYNKLLSKYRNEFSETRVEFLKLYNGATNELKQALDFVQDTISHHNVTTESISRAYDKAAKLIDDDTKLDALWNFTEAAEKLNSFYKQGKNEADKMYRNTAGEIEAREVQERLDMTSDERIKTVPNSMRHNKNVVFAENGESYSFERKDSNKAKSIKEQLKDSTDILNNMEVVAKTEYKYSNSSKPQVLKRVSEKYKNMGYAVERKNFGKVEISEKLINTGLNYLNTEAEFAAFDTIDKVIKYGIKIEDRGNHKKREHGTITFAAPVEINGVRGNVAVVVKETKGNRYKTHRILMPDGSAFVLNEKSEATTNWMTADKDGESQFITSDNNRISQPETVVNNKSQNSSGKVNPFKYDYSKSFSEQIDDYKAKRFPKNDTLIVGKTEDVYINIGFNALPVTIAQGHIKTALDANSDADHYLGETKLKQLPNVIGKPVAIIRSKTNPDRVVALLPFKQNGKTVITPFEIDGQGINNRKRIDSNAITTVFGKGNILQQLSDALNSEANGNIEMFYWNKKEALSLLQSKGLQLPSSLPQDGFIHSIHEKGANINTKFKNVTETQQFKRWFGKSKVVNDDGTPKVVYHGSSENFNTFDITQSRSWDEVPDYDLPGFYFSENAEESSGYGEIKPYYINISKPYTEDIIKLKKEKGSYRKAYEYLINEGYDGIIVDDMGEGFTEYIVLKPENIKSVTDNIGTFDKNNPDIRYSSGEIDPFGKIAKDLEVLNEAYGTIEKGEKPMRDVNIPKQISDDRYTQRFARTVIESDKITDKQAESILEAVRDGVYTYSKISDEKAWNAAKKRYEEWGHKDCLEQWDIAMKKPDALSKYDIAFGEYLLEQAAKDNDIERVMKLAAEIAAEGTRAGQVVQAMRLLKNMDGAGQLVYIERITKGMQEDLYKRLGKKAPEINVSEGLKKKLVEARGQEEIDNAVDEIISHVAEQMPSTWMDKWTAWRYFAMLGNTRTHIRNITGNAVFMPAIAVKNVIATGIEMGVNKVSKARGNGGIERTKTIGVSKKYKDFAVADYEAVKDIISSGGKHNVESLIDERRTIFKFDGNSKLAKFGSKMLIPIEYMKNLNSSLLEREDGVFLKHHYVTALSRYLSANKIDIDTLNLNNKDGFKVLEKAREVAIKEAQKATYRDTSALANTLKNISNKNPVAKVIVEGAIPFKKTPVNIVKRATEYSPVGLIDTLARGSHQLKTGKITVNEFIDKIAAGLSGTGLTILGAALANWGFLRGSSKDDEEEFEELMGSQAYSLVFGDKKQYSYTVDWTAPGALPLFVGVELNRLMENDEDMSIDMLFDSATTLVEPILELSMLDGIERTLKAPSYHPNDKAITAICKELITSYFGQGVPTALGQITRTFFDDVRRTTFVDKESGVPEWLQYPLQSQMNKIPGLSKQQEPYVDEWGRVSKTENIFERGFENFISPGYFSESESSKMEKELIRLSQKTGLNLYPGKAEKSINIDGQKKTLSAKEYTEYQKTVGKAKYDLLTEITSSKEYKKLSDGERADIIDKAYDLATQKTKMELYSGYKPDTWVKEAIDAEKELGLNSSEYLIKYLKYGKSIYSDDAKDAHKNGYDIDTVIDFKNSIKDFESDKDSDGKEIWGSKQKKVLGVINSMDISDDEKLYLYSTQYDTDDYDKISVYVDSSDYLEFLEKTVTLTADKDENGKSISGSKQDKVIGVIDNMNLSSREKAYLYNTMYKETNNPWRSYLN